MNRRTPSDPWLWLVVILPSIAATIACYKLQAVGILMFIFAPAALESGRLPDTKFSHAVARYAACGVLTAVLYMLVAYHLMFEVDVLKDVLGTKEANPVVENYEGAYEAIPWTSIPRWTKIRFQALFCAMGGLMLAAGLTREVRPLAQLGLCSVLALVVYPIFGAWSWGYGWLGRLGFFDFAGGTVVYSVAGWSALAVHAARAWSMHPVRADSDVLTKNHRPWLYACGAALLWPGLGFFELLEPSEFSQLVVSVNLSAAVGAIAASISALAIFRAWRIQFALVGCWAAIAAAYAAPGPPIAGSLTSSLVIGTGAGVLSIVSLWCIDKVRIPDHLGVMSACAVGGAWGTVSAGFLQIVPGPPLVPVAPGTQLIGAGAALVWAFGVFGGITWAALHLLRKSRADAQ